MKKLRKAFTLWYIKRGYTFGYDFSNTPIFGDSVIRTPGDIPPAVWTCPWWVRPLLIFFSPSVYTMETTGKIIGEALARGFEEGFRATHQKSIVFKETLIGGTHDQTEETSS